MISDDQAAELLEIAMRSRRYLVEWLRDESEADEVIGDAILAIVESGTPITHPSAYVFRILRRKAARRRRRSHLFVAVDLARLDRNVSEKPSPEQAAADKELRILAIRARQGLKGRAEEAARRAFLEEQDAATVCREMGISEHAWKNLKSRTQTKIIAAFRGKFPAE